MRNQEEFQHCCAFASWCALATPTIPELKWILHIPNGGERPSKVNEKTGRRYSPEGQRLAKMGVKAGTFDYLLPIPRYFDGAYRPGMWIEFKAAGKRGKPGKLSDDQESFANTMAEHGWVLVTATDWEYAKQVVLQYLGAIHDTVGCRH